MLDIIQQKINAKDLVTLGEPHTPESAEMLCLSCPVLGDCISGHPLCLIGIARRRDKGLHRRMWWQEYRRGTNAG